MIEIEVENKLGLRVFVNGIPKLENIPPEKWHSIMSVLEMEIAKFYENYDKEKTKDEKSVENDGLTAIGLDGQPQKTV